jgi:hypothetical protein
MAGRSIKLKWNCANSQGEAGSRRTIEDRGASSNMSELLGSVKRKKKSHGSRRENLISGLLIHGRKKKIKINQERRWPRMETWIIMHNEQKE